MKQSSVLSNLYFQLLQASSYADKEEYHVFDTDNCELIRTKARLIFSEFDITGYTYGSLAPLQHFTHPLNCEEYFEDNINIIRTFLTSKLSKLQLQVQETPVDKCHCNVPILHKFEVTNRITKKTVFPIGRMCVLKFANTNTYNIINRINTIITKSIKTKRQLMNKKNKKKKKKKKVWRIKSQS